MLKYTLINNARLTDASFSSSKTCSLLLRSGEKGSPSEILQIGEIHAGAIERKLTLYNAKGRFLCPGFVDMSVRVCEPGYMYRERLADAAKAANLAGVTSMLAIPETNPAANEPAVMRYISESSKKMPVTIIPAASPLDPETGKMSAIDELVAGGAGALFCADMTDNDLALRAMRACVEKNIPFVVRCPDAGGDVNLGRVSEMLRVDGIPPWRRKIALFTALTLAKESGCRLHISSVSTAFAVNLIKQAKMQGVNVTCDTCPQYFTFYEDDLFFYGTSLKLSPPLAESSDRAAVIEAIKDGTIDCIASDHTPWSSADKNKDFHSAPFGMIGLQTLFSASYTALVCTGHISLQKLVSLLSENPAKILSLSSGLSVGAKADLTVFSTEHEHVFSSEMIVSTARNSPFVGSFLRGEVAAVFYDGQISDF